LRQVFALLGIDFVDGQRHRFAEFDQHARQIAIGAGDFPAAVHQEDDVGGLAQRHFGLMENLRGNILLVFDDNAAGIDQFERAAIVFGLPVNAVAGDAGLVADNGAPLSRNAIEECGLSNVGPAHNDHCGNGIGHGNLNDSRVGRRAGNVAGARFGRRRLPNSSSSRNKT
jgi:hypothetical protein